MQDNKISISLTTVIIITIVIVALIVGFVCFIIFNRNTEKTFDGEQSGHSEIIPSQNNEKDTNKTNPLNINTNSNINSNSSPTNKENTSNSSTSVVGKSSSKQNPLYIGEWGTASKYASGKYVEVPVKITNIIRGSVAAQEVKNYCESGSSIYRYEDAKENMEWAVIEYSVDLTKMEKESSVTLDRKITGTGNNTSIKYNGITYIVSTMNMTSGYTKGKIVTCKFAVQLPIGCTDYLIVLGSSSSTQAFFMGE